MTVELLQPDLSPITDLALADFQAGADSSVVVIDIHYLRGETVGDPLQDVSFGVAVEDPARPGVGITRGVPPMDELWGRAQEVDPATDQPLGDEVAIGAYRVLPLAGPVPVGGFRRVRVLWHPPSTATATPWRFFPTVWAAEHSRALAVPHLGGPGIVTGVGNTARTALVRGGRVEPQDPADHRLTVGRRQVLVRGRLRGEPSVELALDRVDGDGQALADLERYRARVVWHPDQGVLVRKGPKDPADPALPSLDVGDHELAQVLVEAPAGGGPPVLDTPSLEGGPLYDRFYAEPDPTGGPTLIVHAGDALGAGSTWRWWSRPTSVALPTDSSFYLWNLASGLWTTTSTDEPPAGTAEGPWWRGTTDTGGAITDLVDQRTWCERQIVLQLRVPVGTTGTVWAQLPVEYPHLHIDRVVLWAPDLAGATTGRLLVDLELDAGSLFPSAAAEPVDPRPFLEPGTLRHDSGIPEHCHLRAGQVLAVRGIELPDASPAEVWLSIHCLF